MADLLKSAFRSLGHKRVRTFLTILGIAIGVASVIIIGNISQCGTQAVSTELESLGLSGLTVSTSKGAGASLNEDALSVVKKSPGVEQATPVLIQTTDISTRLCSTKALVWGVDTTAQQIISIQVLYGRIFSAGEVHSSANVCLVDEAFSKEAYQRSNIIGKKISILCGGEEEEFEVVGVVKTGSGLLQNMIGDYIPNFVYVPYTTIQQYLGRTDFDQIAVKVSHGGDVSEIGNTITGSLDLNNGTSNAFTSGNLAKQKDGLNSMLNIITLVLSAVGAISLLVASLSIMTVMLVSVSERTREIGIKKAIGAKRGTIMLEFMFEAILISIIGCAFGLIAGYGASFAGAAILGIQLSVRMDVMLVAVGFSLFTGTVFGVYPAYKASNLKPVEALRSE